MSVDSLPPPDAAFMHYAAEYRASLSTPEDARQCLKNQSELLKEVRRDGLLDQQTLRSYSRAQAWVIKIAIIDLYEPTV